MSGITRSMGNMNTNVHRWLSLAPASLPQLPARPNSIEPVTERYRSSYWVWDKDKRTWCHLELKAGKSEHISAYITKCTHGGIILDLIYLLTCYNSLLKWFYVNSILVTRERNSYHIWARRHPTSNRSERKGKREPMRVRMESCSSDLWHQSDWASGVREPSLAATLPAHTRFISPLWVLFCYPSGLVPSPCLPARHMN